MTAFKFYVHCNCNFSSDFVNVRESKIPNDEITAEFIDGKTRGPMRSTKS